MPKIGRPINPTSERQQKPWEELGMSRATYMTRKHYNDLPISIFKAQWPGGLRNALRKLVREHPHYNLWLGINNWSSGDIRRAQIEWLIKQMKLTRKANVISRKFFAKPPIEESPDDTGVNPPPYQLLEDLRSASLYEAFSGQEKERFNAVAMSVLAKATFSPCA